jgi:DNA-binding winged helix-turn-helix (wHTH) protein
VQNRNRVVSRDRLLERVWGYEREVETRSVDVHVGRLRAKLGSAARQIETVVGLGYRFVDLTVVSFSFGIQLRMSQCGRASDNFDQLRQLDN